jgi:Kef-type K+ transport system membrane component KefB
VVLLMKLHNRQNLILLVIVIVVIIVIVVVIGSTVLGWPWPPLLGFVMLFYGVGLLAPRPTPNLEDRDILFCPDHHP